jgi:hypothetical protein
MEVGMNSNRIRMLMGVLALALIAGCFNARQAAAEEFRGKFTLSVETRWGSATLPPGEYSLTLDNYNLNGLVIVPGATIKVRALMFPNMIEHRDLLADSALITVRNGEELQVSSLYIKQLGLLLEYPLPNGRRQLLAQTPQLIERVPIVRMGKKPA